MKTLVAVLYIVLCIQLYIVICSAGASKDLWVVIVNTSRYWFNYRQAADAVAVYQLVKGLGVTDERIVFMNALDVANDERNLDPGLVHFSSSKGMETWDYDGMAVDYADSEVSAQTFMGLLTNRPRTWSTAKQQLQSNENSSILMYMAGHGGDEFFKFHDSEELSAHDLGHAFQEMHEKKLYKEILLVLDTCQATTMTNYITAPNIMTLAGSVKGENSYGFPTEDKVGVAVADRFTYSVVEFIRGSTFRRAGKGYLKPSLSLIDLHKSFLPQVLHSTATLVPSPGTAHPRTFKLHRFFGGGEEPAGAVEVEEGNLQALEIGSGKVVSGSTAAMRRAVVGSLFAAN